MTWAPVRWMLGMVLSATLVLNARAQDSQTLPAGNNQVPEIGTIDSPPRFTVSAALLYLQPNSGSLEYGALVTPLPLPSPDWAGQSINPNFSPAFRIGLAYALSDCNNVQLNWTHLNATDSSSFTAKPDQMVGPYYEIGPDANAYKIANGSVHFGYDAVNLDAGHLWCAGCPFQLRVFGGLQVAQIHQNLSASFRSYDGAYANGYTNNSMFTGVGPRLGMTAAYNLGHFQFLGEAAGSALIGSGQSRMDYSATSPAQAGVGITPPNLQSLTSPNATQVIPCIDTRLGVAYITPITRFGIFRAEAGYQAAVYVKRCQCLCDQRSRFAPRRRKAWEYFWNRPDIWKATSPPKAPTRRGVGCFSDGIVRRNFARALTRVVEQPLPCRADSGFAPN